MRIYTRKGPLKGPFVFSDKVQRESEHDESQPDPLGGLGQLGVERLGLALGEEGVRAAGDGAGELRAFPPRRAADLRDGDGGDELQDGEEDFHLYRSFRRYSAIARGNIPQDAVYFKSYLTAYAVFLPSGQPQPARLLTASSQKCRPCGSTTRMRPLNCGILGHICGNRSFRPSRCCGK